MLACASHLAEFSAESVFAKRTQTCTRAAFLIRNDTPLSLHDNRNEQVSKPAAYDRRVRGHVAEFSAESAFAHRPAGMRPRTFSSSETTHSLRAR